MLQRRFLLIFPSLFLIAGNAFAGYPSRDAWLPIVGHAAGYGGRVFLTTIYLTDVSHAPNEVTLWFYSSAQPHVLPRAVRLDLGAGKTAAVDVGPQLVGEAGGIGALHIHARGQVIATARIFSRAPNDPPGAEVGAVVNAIASRYAIGTGESTILHVPTGERYKLYAVETHGFPLYFSVMAEPSHYQRRLYLAPNEERSWDVDELFRAVDVSSLRVTGINGSGKILLAGTSIESGSQDFSVFEMSLPTEPRHRLRWPELTAYIACALALIAAAIVARRRAL